MDVCAQKFPHVLILHGLFGNAQNWRTISHKISQQCSVNMHMIDLRNHGNSPHTEDMTLDLMAEDINEYITTRSLKRVSIIGHSLGGRVAMKFALSRPKVLERLVVLDVAPVEYENFSVFGSYITFMKSVPLETTKTRREADEYLQKYVPEYGLRQFLLTNLVQDSGKTPPSFRWRLNFDTLSRALPLLRTFSIPNGLSFNGRTLFIAGELSDYIKPDYFPSMQKLFPNYELISVKGAGHWVHSEKTKEFTEIVVKFLNS